MSKQFRVYLTPLDVDSLIEVLRASVGLRLLQELSPTSLPVDVDSPIRKISSQLTSDKATSVRCFLAPPSQVRLETSFLPKRSLWLLEPSSEVIEFSGCDFDGSTLFVGRFYFQTDTLHGDSIWSKRKQFIDWAEKVFNTSKKALHRSATLNAYVGTDAQAFRAKGGRFASSLKPTGEPIFEKL